MYSQDKVNKMNIYTKQQIEDLAGNALSHACAYIQDQMNIKTGDIAGLFFSGENLEVIESILQDYIKMEVQFKELPTD